MVASSDLGASPSYGIDAPGVMRGFLGTGIALGLASAFVIAAFDTPIKLFGWPLILLAMVLLALGCSMLVYSSIGKQRLRDHLLRQSAWHGDELVLDIGAGRGLMAIGAAHRVPSGRVMALDLWSTKDLSGNTADALRRNAALERVENVIEVITGDARRLDLPDASVDAVVSVFCIHNIEPETDRSAACHEIARVMKPGATAMIADFPSAAGYVNWFKDAGLEVAGSFRAETIALGIAGYLIATKPNAKSDTIRCRDLK